MSLPGSIQVLYNELLPKSTGYHDRPIIHFLSSYFGDTSIVGVEVGVHLGLNAKALIRALNFQRLYLIDSYDTNSDYTDLGDLSLARQSAIETLLPHAELIVWLLKLSKLAALDILEPLDFVYIDGDHDYDPVSADLRAYYPLVKSGGILCGHDYVNSFGAKRAVNDFLLESGYTSVTISPGPAPPFFPDWYIIKH